MSKKKSKKQPYTPNQAAEDAKRDIHRGPNAGDYYGSSFAMPYIKLRSEEARLIQCPDCGFSKGRHSRRCPG